jgi:hypothetical protein
MTALKTLDGKRVKDPTQPGGRQGSGGGTGSSNSPAEILRRLMEAQPELKRLISKLKKDKKPTKKKTKTMKAMGGGMAMKKKGYAMGGAMKKKGYAKGGAMKRTGHMDMRKGGMFK